MLDSIANRIGTTGSRRTPSATPGSSLAAETASSAACAADSFERGEPLRVVLTGYGPFMGIPVNPSDVIGQKVSQMGVQGARIEYRRLDVKHDAVDAFIRDMRANPPDIILSLGYTGGKAQVEEQPENRVGGGREGESHPAGPIVAGEPGVLGTDLPVHDLEAALGTFPHRTVGTHFSDANYHPDRSAYLCDYINYLETDTFSGPSPAAAHTTAGFIHVNDQTTPEEIQKVVQALVDHQATAA